MFELFDVLLLLLFVSACSYWWRAKGIQQYAYNAVKRYCREAELQLLDQSVSLKGFWLKRGRAGSLHIWRSYVFEFSSTGERRYQGRIILLGGVVEKIELEAHRIH
jgi:hypothetical protein